MESLHYYELQQELFTQGSNFYPRATDFHLAQPFDEAYHRSSIFRSAVPIKGLSAVFAPIWALKWFVTLYSGTRFPCNKTKLNFVLDSILKISPTWYHPVLINMFMVCSTKVPGTCAVIALTPVRHACKQAYGCRSSELRIRSRPVDPG